MFRQRLVILTYQVRALPQALNDQLVAFSAKVNVSDVVGGGLKVRSGVVALGDEDVVVDAALEGLVERNGGALYRVLDLDLAKDEEGEEAYHEFLLNLAEALETRGELEMVVRGRLGDGRDDGNVVALGTDTVGAGDDCNVDV